MLDLIPAASSTLSGTLKHETPALKRGEVAFYSLISPESVPIEHRAYVRRHVDRAACRLRLGHVTIRWFVEVTELAIDLKTGAILEPTTWPFEAEQDGEDCGGVVFPAIPMTVHFNAHVRGPIVKAMVAHEVRHVAQLAVLTMLQDAAAKEADAHAFAMAYLDQEPD